MKPSDILDRAAAIVSERWCQGKLGYGGGPRCAIGAIEEASTNPLGAECQFAMTRAEATMGNIAMYNDGEFRTAAEVAAKLREAAEMAREAGE